MGKADTGGLEGLVRRFVGDFGSQDFRTYAASTTYCILLSIFPALIIVSAILQYTALSEADVIDFLVTVMPDASESLIRQICRETYRSASGILPVSIVFMLWSAGLGVMQLTRGLNSINHVEERRNYFLVRLTAMLYTLLVLALMVAILFLQIYARQIAGLWRWLLPDVPVPALLTSVTRFVLLFVAETFLFVLLYATLPATKKNLLRQLPGALVTAAGWEVLGGIFSLYVNFSQSLSLYYGSLATAIVLMLWIYWCLYIFLAGAYLNRFLEQELPAA